MAAAAGRLLRAAVARHVSTISKGISSSASLMPIASRRTCLTNTPWPGSAQGKFAFSTSAADHAPAVTQHAPYFKGTAVVSGEFKEISLDDFKGKYLVLFFYPLDSGGLGHMNITLLSDLTKQISRDYGVLLEGAGIALRGLFIIDPNGVIKHLSVNDLPVGRSVEETLRLVKAFQFVEAHGEVCPANWTPESPTIKPSPVASREYFEKVHQ
uniref:Thioredoxin-dependent peroxide reductase, mitochondrial n=1 Tax=Jaculus jaculus TaxID=51337 RepID=A0A8C5LGR5_JACJA